ncbi:undecaprenyl-diphosphate phosphatase [Culicoidibacter larvae]|uniref:Undecaprenyl-diphosphatase n=1 Tax=Culicoidibacter larvae TaxID=2579976 RepID=A0A5R8QGM7_9FIRM|nr:undecaprenyl-diphosphate phosphatase [Culicoidibacter larvae]TLG77122.1 undecaprenyl-diphosphate phosphatase [Culicoidibacter larvae]
MDTIWQYLQYLILGLAQGITEPLPVSSKGHVVMFNNFFGAPVGEADMVFFLAIVHLASLIAIVWIYREKIKHILVGTYGYVVKKDKRERSFARYTSLLLVSFVIFAFFAAISLLFIDELFSGSTIIVGIGYLITTILLVASDHIKVPSPKTESKITLMDAIFIGGSQVLALIPGVSRSGTTLVAGLFRKFDRETAIDYSFFLFIPTVLGANVVLAAIKAIKTGVLIPSGMIVPYIIAFFASLIGTYFAFKFLLFIVKKQKLTYFAIYTFILAMLNIFQIVSSVAD